RLGPGEHPRDRAKVLKRLASAAPDRSGADPQTAQLLERADLGEPGGETIGLDELAVSRPGGRAGPLGQRAAAGSGAPAALLNRWRRRQEHGGGHLLEVAASDGRVQVAGEDDLALLGDLEAPGYRSRGLGQDRPVGWPAAAAQRAAAAVEECQLNGVPSR